MDNSTYYPTSHCSLSYVCFFSPLYRYIMLLAQRGWTWKNGEEQKLLVCLFLIPYFITSSSDIDAPTNLITTEITEDTATVAWNPVQAEVDGYMLSYTSAEGSSAEIPVGRDSTSYRLIGLRPGVLHTVYIWAFKGDKVSRKSSTEAQTGKLWVWPPPTRGVIEVFDILRVQNNLRASQMTFI